MRPLRSVEICFLLFGIYVFIYSQDNYFLKVFPEKNGAGYEVTSLYYLFPVYLLHFSITVAISSGRFESNAIGLPVAG